MNTLAEDPVTMAYHELRAPLALVATLAKTAAAESSDEELKSRCLSIVRAAERMLATANSLLAFAGTVEESQPTLFEPSVVVASVVQGYRAIGVRILLQEHAAGALFAEGSPAHLEALLASLISNAVTHGDREHEIEVEVIPDRGRLVVRFTNWIGDGKHRGLGLGTYIADRLVRELSGDLTQYRNGAQYTAVLSIPLVTAEKRDADHLHEYLAAG